MLQCIHCKKNLNEKLLLSSRGREKKKKKQEPAEYCIVPSSGAKVAARPRFTEQINIVRETRARREKNMVRLEQEMKSQIRDKLTISAEEML